MRASANCVPCSDLALIRQLHSLQPKHLEVVRLELAPPMLDCTVDGHDDYEGNMMIMVVPNGLADDTRCYILQANHSGIELSVATDDSVETSGTFQTLGEAIERLKQAVRSILRPSYPRVA